MKNSHGVKTARPAFPRYKRKIGNHLNIKETQITFAYWNVNGMDFQSSWAIEKVLNNQVIILTTPKYSA